MPSWYNLNSFCKKNPRGILDELVRIHNINRQREYMYERAKTFTLTRPRFKKVVGWLFVTIGFIALVAPVIPGAPLVFVGIELLGFKLLFLDRIRERFFSR